jgi:hypothetical protein
MLMNIWAAVFVVAVVQAYYLLKGKLPEVIGPFIGLVLFVTLAYSAFNITIFHGGKTSTLSEPSLAILAVAGIMLNAVWLFSEAIEVLPLDAFRGAR